MRVASKLSEYAQGYAGVIEICDETKGSGVNAKNLLDLLLLQVRKGQDVVISVTGQNADNVVSDIRKLL